MKRYAEALKSNPEPREIASMYQQALHLDGVFENDVLANQLKTLLRKGEA